MRMILDIPKQLDGGLCNRGEDLEGGLRRYTLDATFMNVDRIEISKNEASFGKYGPYNPSSAERTIEIVCNVGGEERRIALTLVADRKGKPPEDRKIPVVFGEGCELL